MLAERGVNTDHSIDLPLPSVMRLKWKNGSWYWRNLPIFARGTWMKPT